MELKDGIPTFYAPSQHDWRTWLEQNHATEKSVWLIIFKKETGKPSVYYSEAVDEALCFGWIDSKANTRDAESYYQFFARRSPKSNWSRVNKEKVERLNAQNLIAEAGLKAIELAKQNGTWTALDDVENLTIPEDLQAAFEKNNPAFENWNKFARSAKRGILEWILNAKKTETRQKRIDETVRLAADNLKANFPKPK
ncbi:YdeI/OmpD-associated family protein [Larkinella sp. GY13]|uniref:YdeI/OmpD-associated family protein n=1 Tax=Larkinella sp. GY13 TaxID=3453720 RepID=UPI003EE870F0